MKASAPMKGRADHGDSCQDRSEKGTGVRNKDERIPSQFDDFLHIHLIRIAPKAKQPVNKGYAGGVNFRYGSPDIAVWLQMGGNVGAISRNGFVVFVDGDTKQIQDALTVLPETFTWSTGTPGHRQFAYKVRDEPMHSIPLKDGAYIKGLHGYVLIPPSIHPNGRPYGESTNDIPIATIDKASLLESLKPFVKKTETAAKSIGRYRPGNGVKDTEVIIQPLLNFWRNPQGENHRHDLALAVIGVVARAGGTESEAEGIISSLVERTGVGAVHIREAIRAYRSAVERLRTGSGRVRGIPALAEILKEIDKGDACDRKE